ncbi:hypothetical protein LOTGIDRAFT_229268 [Lottia gigantea]|uniref:RRM domain-containing protein n=1 Tax=Lottia gigantea TaxID=225164 RepID=V3ZWV5_LOTGI|nr:hypothetical protein LOTGIDRAFT_229268 [Lottia gigantea]ESO87110.1 hypothetical protein LOTGIDRAFT_229268 [Lottia gigantea]
MTKSNTPKPGPKTPKTPNLRNSNVGTPKMALNKSINKTPKLPNTPSGDNKKAQQTPKSVKQNLNTPKNQKTPKNTNTPAKTPVTKNKTPKTETPAQSPGQQLKKKTPASQKVAKTQNGVKATPKNQTPAKTPTSKLNGKGKNSVKNLTKQTPKGTAGNKKSPVSSKKAVIKTEESDEDDDDEEDDDFDMEEMENDDDSLEDDDDDDDDDDAVGDNIRNTILDKYLKMAAEDDDEEEDDDEDDDEEEDDEDIKDIELLKGGQKRKTEANQKAKAAEPKAKVAKDTKLTAIKDKAIKTEPKVGEKRKAENEGPKAKVSKPDEKQKQKEKQKPKKVVKEEKIDPEQEKKNRKILFIKNLPQEVTVDEIKALSKDIQDVHLRKSHFKLGKKSWFAFLFFTNETITDKNHKLISSKKLHDKDVVVDFVGEKSKNKKLSKYSSDYELDPLKLYVTGFDETCTDKDLKKLFPKCDNIHMPKRKKGALHGFAFVFFTKPGDAQQALKTTNGKKVKENVLVVLQGKKTKAKVNQQTLKDLKAKKQAEKPAIKIDDDDDDESEDDDDDEEDNDDDDEEDDDDDDEDDDDE